MNLLKNLLLIATFVSISITQSQNIETKFIDSFQANTFINNSLDSLPYRIYIPTNTTNKKLPVLLFLHGRGESGKDNIKQFTHGGRWIYNYVKNNEPAILIFPQCPNTSYWSNVIRTEDCNGKPNFIFNSEEKPTKAMGLLIDLWKDKISELKSQDLIDTNRLYIGGISMGGMGTIELIQRLPHTFSAVFPICGGGILINPASQKNSNFWFFHGEKDDIVNYHHSFNVHKQLLAQGIPSRYTLFSEANHNAWDSTIAMKEVLTWVFSSSKKSILTQNQPSPNPEN